MWKERYIRITGRPARGVSEPDMGSGVVFVYQAAVLETALRMSITVMEFIGTKCRLNEIQGLFL